MQLINLKKTLKASTYSSFWVLVIQCALLCAVLLGLVFFSISSLLLNFTITSTSWLDGAIDVFGVIGSGVLAWFLFPALLPVIILLFHEKVASTVEKEEYQDCIQQKSENLMEAIWHELKFCLWALLLNIICLPFYLVPLINVAVYYLLNSYLLGKETFNIISTRYVDRKTSIQLWKSNKYTILGAGFLITVLSNIPFLNLITPIFAIVFMVHIAKSLVRQ